ncbi:hypothetical protein J6590_050210, partial [Homalodisca vitripennis]
ISGYVTMGIFCRRQTNEPNCSVRRGETTESGSRHRKDKAACRSMFLLLLQTETPVLVLSSYMGLSTLY